MSDQGMSDEGMSNDGIRDELRALPVLQGEAPTFDPAGVPDDPVALFVDWLRGAVDAGVVEPHAVTLSTVDAHGRPNARVLLCKEVDEAGWHVATSTVSRKAAELAAAPVGALTFYWPEQGRQVRVRGPVVRDPDDVRDRDFAARSDAAQASVEGGAEGWASYALAPDEVEFWQAAPDRRHLRLRYDRGETGWSRDVIDEA